MANFAVTDTNRLFTFARTAKPPNTALNINLTETPLLNACIKSRSPTGMASSIEIKLPKISTWVTLSALTTIIETDYPNNVKLHIGSLFIIGLALA